MRFSLAPLCLALLTFSAPTWAEDESTDAGALPSVEVMPCLEKCADFIPAEHIYWPKPGWGQYTGQYVEALVDMRYVINPDGTVGDISLEHVVGPDAFARATVAAVKKWTFKPATIDGKPVAEARPSTVIFGLTNTPKGARPAVHTAYESAVREIEGGDLETAQAEFDKQQAKPELTFYERGMIANLQGMIALQRKDYQAANSAVKLASDVYAENLPPVVTIQLYKTRIISSLASGDIMDAMGATRKLEKIPGFNPNDPITKVANDTRAKLDTQPAFSMSGKIPEGADAIALYLYRRDFTFENIKGSLDNFQLNCKQQSVASKPSDAAEWHVPKNWSQCYLLVRGTAGSTFDVVEYAPDKAPAKPNP